MTTRSDKLATVPREFARSRRLERIALIVCIVLAAVFGTNAWLAVSDKSATFDETAHAPSAYVHLRYNDFRMNPEHPPLWKYWAALPWLFDPPADMRMDDPDFASRPNVWSWSPTVLYHTSGNDGRHLLAMSRFMMLLVGVGLCGLIAWFAWRTAGPVAAMAAAALFAFDPNFLAHSPLVTNDVSFALVTLSIAFCLWRCGQRLTRGRVITLCLLCAAAVTTKFTGILLGPVVLVVLLIRAFSRSDWPAGKRVFSTRIQRLGAVVFVCVACAITSFVLLWAAYGFRYTVSSDLSLRPNFEQQITDALTNRIGLRTGVRATPEQLAAEPLGLTLTSLGFLRRHELLPEAFLDGVAFVYANSFNRMSFFFDEVNGGANHLYFPVAIAVKTPITTLLLVAGALLALVLIRRWGTGDRADDGHWLWTCLLVPLALLLFVSIASPLNIGHRHLLPLYPLAYVMTGVIAARAVQAHRRLAWVIAPLLLVLAVETCGVFPNYLSYFNLAAGGARGGSRILGDSNLDWGQDLPALAHWQKTHETRTLYLAYFGTADPAYYGVRAEPITLGTDFARTRPTFPDRGVVAASVTMLQAKWKREEAAAFFKSLREREPDQILGGSIYLFDLGPE